MRRAPPAVLLVFALAVLPVACQKSSPGSGVATATSGTGPAVKPAPYDLKRFAEDLRGTTAERRDRAIRKAVEPDEEGEDVRRVLVEALKDSTAGKAGATTANQPNSTRETAVQALLKLGDKGKKALKESGLKTLENGLRDARPNVREHTVNAIAMAGAEAKSSADAVARLCADKEPQVRSAAYRALQRMKPVNPAPILKLPTHPELAVAMDAAGALEWLKPTGPEAVAPLVEAVKREAKEMDDAKDVAYIRAAAAEALGGVGKGAESTIPALVELLLKAKPED